MESKNVQAANPEATAAEAKQDIVDLNEEIDWDEAEILPPMDENKEAQPEAKVEAKPAEEEATGANGGPILVKRPIVSDDERDARSIFVKNVHFRASEKDIEEHFKDSGKILKVTVRKDKMT